MTKRLPGCLAKNYDRREIFISQSIRVDLVHNARTGGNETIKIGSVGIMISLLPREECDHYYAYFLTPENIGWILGSFVSVIEDQTHESCH